MTATESRVSIIVPTLNSAGTLRRCLLSVAKQTYPNIELILVDGGSVDGTLSIAMELGARVVQMPSGRTDARIEGVRTSSGRFLLFLDSDQVLAPEVVEQAAFMCERAGFDAVEIPEREVGEGFWFSCRAFDQLVATNAGLGYPRFFSRAVYSSVEGHTPGLTYLEDRDLFLKLTARGGRVGRTRAMITHEIGAVNPIQIGQKTSHYADDARRYYRNPPPSRNHEGPWAIVGPRFSGFIVAVASGEWKLSTVAVLPLYALVVHGPKLLKVLWASIRRTHS